jgi:hypothetical protein
MKRRRFLELAFAGMGAAAFPGLVSAGDGESGLLKKIDPKTPHLILIDDFESVKRISKVLGFSGRFGHIEVLYGGKSFGCRPNQCAEIDANGLSRRFAGADYEVRSFQVDGSVDNSVRWFRSNLEGRPYDLITRNCTDTVVGMYAASGDKRRIVHPVDVLKAMRQDPEALEIVLAMGDSRVKDLVNKGHIYLPDQFEKVGTYVGRGKF